VKFSVKSLKTLPDGGLSNFFESWHGLRKQGCSLPSNAVAAGSPARTIGAGGVQVQISGDIQ